MIEDRLPPPPRLRRYNPAVSPAVESIVRHCLEADPDRRYQTARQLHEDLERHLHDLPLRHAREPSRPRARRQVGAPPPAPDLLDERRRPRGSSSSLGLGALFAWRAATVWRGWRPRESLPQFRDEMREAQIALPGRGDGAGRRRTRSAEPAAGPWTATACWTTPWQQAADRPAPVARGPGAAACGRRASCCSCWRRCPTRVRPRPDDAQLVAGPWSLNARADSCYPADQPPAALLHQRAALLERLGRQAEAKATAAQGPTRRPCGPRGTRCLLACAYTARGRFREALPAVGSRPPSRTRKTSGCGTGWGTATTTWGSPPRRPPVTAPASP